MAIRLVEKDETGQVLTTYISTQYDSGKQDTEAVTATGIRIDVIKSERKKNWLAWLLAVFLPVGYPNSVTEDYLWYQIYDSLQAFASSIAGLLASRAVLQGVGVGDANASPTTALLLSVLQDSMGRIATIIYAHRYGTAFEPECKLYRLAADVFNDTAMILDCLSPALPKGPRVLMLAGSSVLRALCGVAAGSAKASLSMHFAKWGNLGELNAKDSSQETIISLLGMLAGSFVVARVTTPLATWSCLIGLLSIHLGMNHAAVRAVNLHTLNRQRASLVLSAYLHEMEQSGSKKRDSRQQIKAMSPVAASAQEYVFDIKGPFRWLNRGPSLGHVKTGASIQDLMTLALAKPHQHSTGSMKDTTGILARLLHTFQDERYILWYSRRARTCMITFKASAEPKDHLKAWAHALLIAHCASQESATKVETQARTLKSISETGHLLTQRWDACIQALELAGWDLSVVGIELESGVRIDLEDR